MIRQAVSCDICGTEKRQTNHWFVVRESAGELHIGGWNSRHRSRAGSRHLCGQTCLHKLVDEFMARLLSSRMQPAATELAEGDGQSTVHPADSAAGRATGNVSARAAATDTSLTSNAAYAQPAARLDPLPAVLLSKRPPAAVGVGPVAVPTQPYVAPALTTLIEEPSGYLSRSWRAEAWERERAREPRSGDRQQHTAARRR